SVISSDDSKQQFSIILIYAYLPKPIRKRRTPQNELPDLCAHALGRAPDHGGPCALRLLFHHVLPFPARTALGDVHSWVHLFGEHFVEHQRHIPQLHSQPVLPFAAAESSVWHHGIGHGWVQP